ncbi:MAG: FAD-dependent oxidoreductase [Saprospiraceae bacterium]|nr:FAD-dependent oxidoreductase [Saprospiraceae bacterium]
MRIGILGGGVIGLFSAYYLVQSGHEVVLVDQHGFDQGASYGNAGMICPSHFIPLAAPGVVRQSIKWMFKDTSPFYLKPRWDADFLKWGVQFFSHATKSHVQNSIGPLSSLLFWSRLLYSGLAGNALDFKLYPKGIIMACNTAHGLSEEIEMSKKGERLGMKVQVLNFNELEKINPGVRINALGGVHYLDDMHLHPGELMKGLISYLKDKVEWRPNSKVLHFNKKNRTIRHITTTAGEIGADAFILAAGAWSGELARLAGGQLNLEGGKGYNITLEDAQPQFTTPMILVEGRVAVTPMGKALRLGGTMELAGINNRILSGRIEGILNTIETYLPDYQQAKLKSITPWFGFRPLSATGLPLISRLEPLENVFLNTGHGMLGLSLAPVSGHLIDQLIYNYSKRV